MIPGLFRHLLLPTLGTHGASLPSGQRSRAASPATAITARAGADSRHISVVEPALEWGHAGVPRASGNNNNHNTPRDSGGH